MNRKTRLYAKTNNENVTVASYRVSYCITLAEEDNTIAETLTKPCVVEMAESLLDE